MTNIPKLENLEGKQPSQITKYYFPEYSVKLRKKMENSFKNENIELFNDMIFNYYQNIQQQIKTDTPLLLNSIILNSLGFEYNERLLKTCYMDYHNKAISKHGKQFIEGQYRIFRNDNEKLLLENTENTEDTIKRLDEVISLILEVGVGQVIELKDHLEAIKKDPKSIQGIVNKVLNNKN